MFRTRSPSTERRDAGFTILEALVALSLVAIVIVAIGSVMSSNVRGVRTLDRHLALTLAMRTAMATAVPPRDQLAQGTSSGQTDGYHWTVDVSPLGGNWTVPNSEAAWVPQLVRIRVRSASGATSDIRTVRLIRRSSE